MSPVGGVCAVRHLPRGAQWGSKYSLFVSCFSKLICHKHQRQLPQAGAAAQSGHTHRHVSPHFTLRTLPETLWSQTHALTAREHIRFISTLG